MSVENEFSMYIAIPMANVPALAAALHEYDGNSMAPITRGEPITDAEAFVATFLYYTEGGDSAEGVYTETVDNDGAQFLVIWGGNCGRLGFDADVVETIYAAHGGKGHIKGRSEDYPYLTVLEDGKTRTHSGETYYMGYDNLGMAISAFAAMDADELLKAREELGAAYKLLTGSDL